MTMLVARRSFVATLDDGEKTPIFRGRSRVVADHELARRYPDSWEQQSTRDEV
jgi:hypothetical protein